MTSRASAVPRLSWSEVCARRLGRHALTAPARDATPADIAAALCGAHAQVMLAAELSIGLRLAGATRATIRDALWTERSLVKTRGPRGTVHLLPARELPMWTGALSALPPGRNPLPAGARLAAGQAEAILAAIEEALADADLTADELTGAIVERAGSWAGDPVMEAFGGKWPRWRQIEGEAMNRGALCFGPHRGRKATYTSPRRLLPGFRPAEGRVALAGLLRCYLHTYGPATPAQFAQWLAAPRRWATALFDSLAAGLEEVEVEGERAWVVGGDAGAAAAAPAGVRLLPYFDPYAVGCHPRERVFPGAAAGRALSGGQAGTFPILLIGGIVAGVWHQRRAGRFIEITVEPLAPLTAAQRRDLDGQVSWLGGFLGGTPRLTIGPVTVGAHA